MQDETSEEARIVTKRRRAAERHRERYADPAFAEMKRAYSRAHNAANKEQRRAYLAQPEVRERNRERNRARRQNPEYQEAARERARRWLERPGNKERAAANAASKENKARVNARNADPDTRIRRIATTCAWRASDRGAQRVRDYNESDVVRERRSRGQRERTVSDPQYRIARCLRSRLNSLLRGVVGSRSSAVRDLGCSLAELVKHLEAQFEPWMTWQNHGNKAGDWWSIDHIRPLASFDLTDPEQQRAACHYTNLQPMRHTENVSKGDRWSLDAADSVR